MAGLKENQSVGCGSPWELLFGKLKPICLGTLGIWHLQFV